MSIFVSKEALKKFFFEEKEGEGKSLYFMLEEVGQDFLAMKVGEDSGMKGYAEKHNSSFRHGVQSHDIPLNEAKELMVIFTKFSAMELFSIKESMEKDKEFKAPTKKHIRNILIGIYSVISNSPDNKDMKKKRETIEEAVEVLELGPLVDKINVSSSQESGISKG